MLDKPQQIGEKQASSEIAESRERFERASKYWHLARTKAAGVATLNWAHDVNRIQVECLVEFAESEIVRAERDTRERCAQIVEDVDIDDVFDQPGTLAEFWKNVAERILGKE